MCICVVLVVELRLYNQLVISPGLVSIGDVDGTHTHMPLDHWKSNFKCFICSKNVHKLKTIQIRRCSHVFQLVLLIIGLEQVFSYLHVVWATPFFFTLT